MVIVIVIEVFLVFVDYEYVSIRVDSSCYLNIYFNTVGSIVAAQ